jgi:phosphatidylserine/phosphatidylglycerophosphate/cardiolipin synthase-like enzyme
MSKILVGVNRLIFLLAIVSTLFFISQCDLLLLSTGEEEAEWFVFFNKTAGEGGGDRLDLKLAEQILSAEQTVDLCFYEIDSDTIIGAILAAHNSGTQVRLITDDAYLPEVQELLDASVPVLSDSAGSVYIYKDMHNKFAVFDAEWVWTGSYNATENGTFGNANNAILFRSEDAAVAYTAEFQEMWGSTSAIPNPEASRFHTGKEDNHLHTFELDGYTLELYMSPSDGTKESILSAIATADYSISFCIFSFTDDDISDAMEAQLEDVPGLTIRGVFDETQAGSQYSEIHKMLDWGNQVEVLVDAVTDSAGAEKFLHHKYLLVDAGYEDSDPLVITGSCNWSTNGFSYNDENTIISYHPDIVDLYLSEFEERFAEGVVPE